jgi:hypothetical protein
MAKSNKLKSVVKCPICKYKKEVAIPVDSCLILYDCEECSARLKPKKDDCCIFCSYGSIPCTAANEEGKSNLSRRQSGN